MALPSTVTVSEITLQSVTGGTSGSPATITRDGEWTVAVVTNSDGGHGYVQLPSGCNVGDVVEVYWLENALTRILTPSGETIVDGSTYTPSAMAMFRKVASTQWGFIT